jgi:DNA-directed RNA polymerase subunit RPC12/RpoP
MTEIVKFKCNDCGHRFEQQILTEREKREAQRDRRPTMAIQCPMCGSQRVQRV